MLWPWRNQWKLVLGKNVGEKFPAIPYLNIVCPVQADAVITKYNIYNNLRKVLNYIIILLSLLHRLSLAIMKTIGLSTKFTDHQCVITWSILFTSWSSYLRSIWWTVYWKTSPYYRCVHCCTCCLWYAAYDHSVIFLLSWFTNLQRNCPFWKPELKTKYPLISHLFLCASCVWPLTLGSL